VAKAADAKDVEWVFIRAGGEHDVYRLGKTIQVSIPRHQEINEITARKIMAAGENELGKGWWR